MAKDVNKTQKKNIVKEEKKKQSKKDILKEEKVVEEVINTKKTTKEKEFVKKERNNDKLISVVKTVDDNRKAILFGIVGFLIATLLFRCILWPDRIATLKDGTQPIATVKGKNITADDLYLKLRGNTSDSFNTLLDQIDDMLLTELYPENEEMMNEIDEMAEYYYSAYEQYYQYTQEMTWSAFGASNEKEFLDSLKLIYRRNEYYEEYVEGLITEKEINKYYENDVFGDVDSKHILVKVDEQSEDGLSDDEAKKIAKEIIKKLNDGKKWEEVTEEYKDKIITEELGYMAFNASLEASYLKECKNLEVGKYSKEPVKTSYGYHIVFKIAQKDKPSLEDVKDDVIDVLATEKKNADNTLSSKALISLREESNLEFADTVFGEEYKKYVNNYK